MECGWLQKSLVVCCLSSVVFNLSGKLFDLCQLKDRKWQVQNTLTNLCHSVAVSITATCALVFEPELAQDVIHQHSDLAQTSLCITAGFHIWDLADVTWHKWNGKWTNLVVLHHLGAFVLTVPMVALRKMVPFICIGQLSMIHESVFMLTRQGHCQGLRVRRQVLRKT